METDFLTGWDHDREVLDFANLMNYQEFCGGEQFIYDWSEVRDRIYEEAKLYDHWQVVHPKLNYTVAPTKTNGCVSYGVSAAIEDMLDIARQKEKEVDVFRCGAPWLYAGYHNMIKGRPGTGGCSMAGMMRFIAEYGILPYDTQPKIYADGEVDWNRNPGAWRRVFVKFAGEAEKFQIKVEKLPRTFADIVACLKAGYTVPYGTDKKLVLDKKTGFYVLSGRTAHCMSWSGFGGDFTYNKNSWCDGRGKQRLSDMQVQVNSAHFDAFVVLDVERTRKGKANYGL
jgi:hypothetical protein